LQICIANHPPGHDWPKTTDFPSLYHYSVLRGGNSKIIGGARVLVPIGKHGTFMLTLADTFDYGFLGSLSVPICHTWTYGNPCRHRRDTGTPTLNSASTLLRAPVAIWRGLGIDINTGGPTAAFAIISKFDRGITHQVVTNNINHNWEWKTYLSFHRDRIKASHNPSGKPTPARPSPQRRCQ